MHSTYELYLEDQDGARRFEALTCANSGDLIAAVRRVLDQGGVRSVEVFQFGEHLFTVAA